MNNICPNQNCQNCDPNKIKIHDKKRKRLICKICNRTWYKHKSIQPNLKSETTSYKRALALLEHNVSIRITAKYTNKKPSFMHKWNNYLESFQFYKKDTAKET